MHFSLSLYPLDWSHPWELKEGEAKECLRLKPHHCMLGWVGHCIPGGPAMLRGSTRKNRGFVSGCHRLCPISGFQRLLTTCRPHFSTQRATQFEKPWFRDVFRRENPRWKTHVLLSPERLGHLVTIFQNPASCIIMSCGTGSGGENWINKSRRRRNNEPEMRVVRGKKLIYIAHHASLKPLFDPRWS